MKYKGHSLWIANSFSLILVSERCELWLSSIPIFYFCLSILFIFVFWFPFLFSLFSSLFYTLTIQFMEKMNPQNPVYLHRSDGPNTMSVDKLTYISNYRRWRRTMKIALSSKKELGFINGTVTRDEEDRVKGDLWDTCNDTVIGWIMGIKQTIMYMLTSGEIWLYLERRFSISNGSLKYKLNKELYETKQGSSSTNE